MSGHLIVGSCIGCGGVIGISDFITIKIAKFPGSFVATAMIVAGELGVVIHRPGYSPPKRKMEILPCQKISLAFPTSPPRNGLL